MKEIASWHTESIESSDNNINIAVYEDAKILSNRDFLRRLQNSARFRSWYSIMLTKTGFDAFFWENRPFSAATLSKPYECNLVRSKTLAVQSPDRNTFREHFDNEKEVVSFWNLGNDARLVAPVPKNSGDDFTHIGKFLRKADKKQTDAFWRTAAVETLKRISDKPVWLSTSGLGVFWLHVRIDRYPKYYQTEEYKTL